jgi:hypothetical protein
MNIQISNNALSAIGGYKQFKIENELINLSTLSDNECENILANEIIDYVSIENIMSVVQQIVKKLRLGGTLVIGGTDIRLFAKNVSNCLIGEGEASQIIKEKLSMTNPQKIIGLLSQLGLKVQSSIISGVHYEITAVRG